MAKLQSAFKLVESASESGASGPFPEFQFRLKRDLEEAMGTVVREERAFDLTSNSLEGLAILPEVQHYVEYFRGSGKLTFERARSRLMFYQGMMERIFEEEGIPKEFIVQAQIESGFDPLALTMPNETERNYTGCPKPAARRTGSSGPRLEQQSASLPSMTTAGTERIPSAVARWIVGGAFISRTVTSQDGHATRLTNWIASSQTVQPALKISI